MKQWDAAGKPTNKRLSKNEPKKRYLKMSCGQSGLMQSQKMGILLKWESFCMKSELSFCNLWNGGLGNKGSSFSRTYPLLNGFVIHVFKEIVCQTRPFVTRILLSLSCCCCSLVLIKVDDGLHFSKLGQNITCSYHTSLNDWGLNTHRCNMSRIISWSVMQDHWFWWPFMFVNGCYFYGLE